MMETIESLINECDPERSFLIATGGRCGNEAIFHFCQKLKTHESNFRKAEPHIKLWYKKWSGKLADGTGWIPPYDEVEIAASELWDKIKFSSGGELDAAKSKALRRYNETIPEVEGYGGEPEKRLALVCYELDCMRKPEPFWLSGYDAAEILGLDRKGGQHRGDIALKVLIKRRIIELVKLQNTRKARRYRYIGSPPIKINLTVHLRESERSENLEDIGDLEDLEDFPHETISKLSKLSDSLSSLRQNEITGQKESDMGTSTLLGHKQSISEFLGEEDATDNRRQTDEK